jgi:phospholipid/cholesterol/gamma-HCH transport system substrate-binding protein
MIRLGDRNQIPIGVVAVVLMALGTLGTLATQNGLFRRGYTITAEFRDAAGLAVGDQVLIAGIAAGKVTGLALDGDHVDATLQVNNHELPTGTRAEIVLRTLVGRRSVEMIPEGDWSRPMREGDVIPVTRTGLPTDVPEFGDVTEELLTGLDAEALDTFVGSVTDVARDQREELETLIVQGTRLTDIVNSQEEDILRLLERLRIVSGALADRDREIVRIIDDFGLVVDRLADRREEVRRLLTETNRTSKVAADLVGDKRAEIDTILSEIHADTRIISAHQLDLAEALAYAGDAIGGFSSIHFAGTEKVPWGQVLVTSAGPAGNDVLLGCSGLLDRQLDLVFGPDPRSCHEQENTVRQEPEGPEGPLQQLPRRLGPDAILEAGLAPAPADGDAG